MNKMRVFGKILAAVLLLGATLGGCLLTFTGCSSTPYAWETKFYDVTTNVQQVMVWTTNTVVRTNVLEKVVTTTNVVEATGAIQITMTPTKEYTVLSEPQVTVFTNVLVSYTYAANTNAAAVGTTAGGIANLLAPGSGGLVTTAIAGLAALWGGLRSRKLKKTAGVLAQGIEIYGEVTKAMGPTGERVDGEVKAWLKSDQRRTGTWNEVLALLENVVDDAGAREAAAKVREFINRP